MNDQIKVLSDKINKEKLRTALSGESKKLFSETIEIDELDFKPLGPGLGFHQNKKEIIVPRFGDKKEGTILPTPMEISRKNISSKLSEMPAPTLIETSTTVSKLPPDQRKVLLAFLIDLTFILVLTALLGVLTLLVLHVDLKQIPNINITFHTATVAISLFALTYLSYFTLFDLVVTFGKSIFHIRVVDINNDRLSIKQTLVRSMISLLSLALLGIPSLLDFHGKLSDTRVE